MARYARRQARAVKGGAGGKATRACDAHKADAELRDAAKDKGGLWLELLSSRTWADRFQRGNPLLSASTSAKPKIANYHFTTLAPNLGVARRHDQSFIMADIPGLIEGASAGAGLGHDFLRHVERTRMLIHVLDASGSEGRDVIEDYEIIRRELAGYSQALTERPEIVAANKMDLPDAAENAKRLREYLKPHGVEVFEISAQTGEGVDELLEATYQLLMTLPMPSRCEDGGGGMGAEKDDEGRGVRAGRRTMWTARHQGDGAAYQRTTPLCALPEAAY